MALSGSGVSLASGAAATADGQTGGGGGGAANVAAVSSMVGRGDGAGVSPDKSRRQDNKLFFNCGRLPVLALDFHRDETLPHFLMSEV